MGKFLVYDTLKNEFAYLTIPHFTGAAPISGPSYYYITNNPNRFDGRYKENPYEIVDKVAKAVHRPGLKLVTSDGLLSGLVEPNIPALNISRDADFWNYLVNDAPFTEEVEKNSNGYYKYSFNMYDCRDAGIFTISNINNLSITAVFENDIDKFTNVTINLPDTANYQNWCGIDGRDISIDLFGSGHTKSEVLLELSARIDEFYDMLNLYMNNLDSRTHIVTQPPGVGIKSRYQLRTNSYLYPLNEVVRRPASGSAQYYSMGLRRHFWRFKAGGLSTYALDLNLIGNVGDSFESLDEAYSAFNMGGIRRYVGSSPLGTAWSSATVYTAEYIEQQSVNINNLPGVRQYISQFGSDPIFSDALQQAIDNYQGTPDIYSPGGTTDTPHNPYPTGTIVPNFTGNTTSQNTSGTWALPFDDISTDHSDVQSVDTGLYRMFGMTKLQMQALANALFTSPSEIGENLVKLIFGSPLEAVISCMEYPFEVSPFGMDDIHFIWDTEAAFPAVNGKALSSEYLQVDFGTITVNRYSGTFYDFEPYTTAELYIPYIGFVPLTPTEIMGATLEIKGWVHLATGEMCIFVKSSTAGIIGTYTTIVGRQLPISSYDFREMYAAIIKTAAVAATGIAAGVNAIPGILAANRNQVKAYDKLQEAIGKGGRYPVGALSHYRATERATDKAITNFANVMSEATADTTASAITAVATGSSVSRNNSFTSGSGRCSPQDCFLRLTYPHQNVPANQNLLAYPVNADGPLSRSDLHGYTVVRTIHLQGIPATSEEIGELEQLLMGGVWLP